ncbi:MAG: IS21 family transposase [Deltaproteobacteria bacterium]
MSNKIKVNMLETIKALNAKGWSNRRIARELGVHRETVRKHLVEDSKCTISTAGDLSVPGAEGRADDQGNAGRKSLCANHEERIRTGLESGLSAQRIFQDMRAEAGFEGSYESVKRYVRKIEGQRELPFRRMEALPGSECQVDYGTGAGVVDEQGKRSKTHLFRITLSYSRKGYSEVSIRQTTDSFLRAMENAFRMFGGVPERIVIDNLKAGVLHPDVYDPELNPKLRDFARHYGTCIMPTRAYTPRHKGKVERQVDYVQENALKSRTFRSLAEQNEFLRTWEAGIADQRIHGTVRRQVGKLFSEERGHLRPLPPDLFPSFTEGLRKVHRDGHVEVAKAYYSVPPEHVQREVWVRYDGRIVTIFNHQMKQITVHASQEPGQFSTRQEHIPKEKIGNPERGNEWMLRKAAFIGEDAHAWAKAMLQNRGIPGARVLNGLLSLTEKHPADAINLGCRKALESGAFSMNELKNHILHAHEYEQQTLPFIQQHPLIRDMHEYALPINTEGLFT